MRESRTKAGCALVAIAALALSAGCSGSTKKGAAPSPTPLTVAKAQALADAAVLTDADMTGYTSEKQTHDASDDASDARIATCLGITKPTYLARNFGTAFTKGAIEVDSSADVASTAEAARSELTAMTGPKAEACIKTEFTSLIAGEGGTVSSFSLTPVTIDVPGSDGAFGYRMAIKATGGGQTLEFNGFDIGALVGPAEIDVTMIDSSGASGFTLDQGVALLKTVSDRAKAAA